MNQAERRYFLIKELLKEQPGYRHMEIPRDQNGQKQLLRSLMNVRMPGAATQEFLEVQDAYLQEETAGKGIVSLEDIEPVAEGIYLWQGDITTLRCDAIVNAANSGMTGCYAPCHGCIDNCIHTFFAEKYDFQDMYTGGFYPYETPEEHWAYWSRYIYVNRYMDAPKPVYRELLELVKDKDYFVITTNVDHCFQKAGFDRKRLFYTQGDYGLFQCSEPCCRETFENEDIIRRMMDQQKDMRIPSELLPVCPHCGKPLTMNLRADNKFVEDAGWYLAAERYSNFLRTRKNLRILFLELGVGYNTPGIIKYPFWQMTEENPKAIYACVNYGEAACPHEIKRQSICIDGDIGEILKKLL